MTERQKTPQLSFEEFKTILNGLELQDFRLTETHCQLFEEDLALHELEVSFGNSSEYQEKSDSVVWVYEYFSVRIYQRNPERNFVNIEAKFRLTFTTEHSFTEEFFAIYRDQSLKLNSWPFFREFVQSQTSRLNIPPLTLPLFKLDGYEKHQNKSASRPTKKK